MSFVNSFLTECKEVLNLVNEKDIDDIAVIINNVRSEKGRLFVIGSGGGAGHASHAVCDFRKLCVIEAYSPYDNVSELTARVNDEGWDVTILNWLKTSKLNSADCIFIFSVGGGSKEKNISMNLVKAIEYAGEINAKIVGIVGKDGGYTKAKGNAVVVIPIVNKNHITSITEGFQALIWHLLVSHPILQIEKAKWESTS